MEYYQGGIEVELTSHDGPIVSRTMPQDYEYRGTGDYESSPRRKNDTMHQHRRSYGNLTTSIPVKPVASFSGKDSDSMVGAATPVVWDAPPGSAEVKDWDVPPAPPGGVEKENESSRYLRSYERRPAPSPLSSMRSLRSKGDDLLDDRSSICSDDDASDISSSAMGSLRRRNRMSQIHADKLLIRQQKDNLDLKKKKKPLRSKMSINEVQPISSPTSTTKVAPKNVSFGAKSLEEKSKYMSVESKLEKVPPFNTKASLIETSSCSTEEKSNGPIKPDDPSNSSVIASSVANSNSPDRSVGTNWTYSTAGSGRVYRTQIICSGKYKGRVTDKIVTINPDDLRIGRALEGLENGFVDQENFCHALIAALFDADMKKEPLHRMKQWETSDSTISRLEKQSTPTKEMEEPKLIEESGDILTTATTDTTMATSASEESENGDNPVEAAATSGDNEEDPVAVEEIPSPPVPKRVTKPPLSPNKESGDVQFMAEKTASLTYKDVFGMASAKGIIHFYEDRDEIWIEDYHFCFASRRFKFLSG